MGDLKSCVLFSTADWDAPYWTNKQHTAMALAKLGIKTLYIESFGLRVPSFKSKKDWIRIAKRIVMGLRTLLFGATQVKPNIWVISPIAIPFKHNHWLVKLLNQSLLGFEIKRFLIVNNMISPLIWTYHPYMLNIIKDGIAYRKLVYHCVDDLSAVPGINAEAFKLEEARLLKEADLIFATAPALMKYCSKFNKNTIYLPNVVDFDHFSKSYLHNPLPIDLISIPEPRLGYHGVLSDYKIDFQLLIDVARMKPEWSLVFIGEQREGQENPLFDELSGLHNVYLLGYRDYDLLPDYLRGIQVGLLPSLINKYTDSMFPMKYYEYLSAGIPVVSTKIAFCDLEMPGLISANSTWDFAKALELQIANGRFDKEVAKKMIGQNTWDGRMIKMIEKIESNQDD